MKPISVIICAKNEYLNLKSNLSKILEQDYPTFEVIVIDDGSSDETPKLLQSLEDQYDHFFSFRIEPKDKQHPGKKQALLYGVSVAKFQHILLTDADCYPSTKNWIRLMTEPLHKSADIVLGVSPLIKTKGFLNQFFRMECNFVALQYINFTLAGLPFMGVGRNLAYKKKVFESHNMATHWDLVSGDDDLLINALSGEYAIEVVSDTNSFTYSKAPDTLSSWFNQKLRHYSTGFRYGLTQKIWLGYYWLSSILLYISLIFIPILIVLGHSIEIYPAILMIVAAMLRWIITSISLKKLKQQNINFIIPLLDLIYILSVWIISPISMIVNRKWK